MLIPNSFHYQNEDKIADEYFQFLMNLEKFVKKGTTRSQIEEWLSNNNQSHYLFDFLKNRDFLKKFSRLLNGKFKEFYHFEGDDDYYLRKTHFLQNGPKISLNDLKNIDSKQKRKLLKK